MTDAVPDAEDAIVIVMSSTGEIDPEMPPDVEFVVPASAYSTLGTDLDFAATPSHPALPPPVVDLSAAMRAIEGLSLKMETLASSFDREVRAESTREKIVDRLHAELQEYKQDLVQSLMKPIFLDLIQLHDDIGKIAATLSTTQDGHVHDPQIWLANIRQGIEDILYRQGVESFTTDQEDFDARRQRAVTTVATEDPALGRKVAARIRPGFTAGDRVIRPEVVSVYALRRP